MSNAPKPGAKQAHQKRAEEIEAVVPEDSKQAETPKAPDPMEAMLDEQSELMNVATAESLLGGKSEVLGIQLRPVTLASIAMLTQIGSDLIAGKTMDECENIIMDCCHFIRIQTLPLKEAAALCRDLDALDDASLEFADKIPPKDIKNVVAAITRILQEATETQVEPQDEKGREMHSEMMGSGE